MRVVEDSLSIVEDCGARGRRLFSMVEDCGARGRRFTFYGRSWRCAW
ncbi:hypothetical protein [Paracerasibacillus soli]|uniref:Uncharacterized protein n=1 Tax=Paracerasibacillus soli TaxID=480284 RepID=A0ABU5CU53_9BACI|nr:hypothetical protein [Virgibacillus soli]MDY0409377.1 hypothetical protein [Virgibacillus soli]